MLNMKHENPFGKILCRCYQVSNIAEKFLFNHLTNLEKHIFARKNTPPHRNYSVFKSNKPFA